AGGNPPPVTIHTWLERFNKQKPYSFEKATTPVDTENCISHMEKIFDVMGCEDAFKTILVVSTLNHLICMSYTDLAQVANAARNYEILHERDDDDTERPDKRQKSDRRSGGDKHRSNNNYSGSNNRNSNYGRDQRNKGQQSNRSANSDTQESVVELLVLALRVVKLVIYRRIARRTPLQVHLVRLIRSQVLRVVFSP
nr:zinc finger, CCHC-type, retrotransposon Gag domain protein [Tanacetum cinerariifolium]